VRLVSLKGSSSRGRVSSRGRDSRGRCSSRGRGGSRGICFVIREEADTGQSVGKRPPLASLAQNYNLLNGWQSVSIVSKTLMCPRICRASTVQPGGSPALHPL